jgi:hypothetical protein
VLGCFSAWLRQAQARLKPQQLERYMANNDREFETKTADIVALCMNRASKTQ